MWLDEHGVDLFEVNSLGSLRYGLDECAETEISCSPEDALGASFQGHPQQWLWYVACSCQWAARRQRASTGTPFRNIHVLHHFGSRVYPIPAKLQADVRNCRAFAEVQQQVRAALPGAVEFVS